MAPTRAALALVGLLRAAKDHSGIATALHLPFAINAHDDAVADGATALIASVGYGNHEVFTALLQRRPDLDISDKSGHTALAHTVVKGEEGMFEALLEAKANIDVTDLEKKTPLMHAIALERMAMAEKLVERKADLSAEDKDKCRALTYAVQKCGPEVSLSLATPSLLTLSQ